MPNLILFSSLFSFCYCFSPYHVVTYNVFIYLFFIFYAISAVLSQQEVHQIHRKTKNIGVPQRWKLKRQNKLHVFSFESPPTI